MPVIAEIGSTGAYQFLPVFTDPDRALIYSLYSGAADVYPRRSTRFMRPEDWAADDATNVLNVVQGGWEIKTTGPDANRLIFYDTDGVTVLKKFDLTDVAGDPTTISVYKRTPV